ncbi:hypothetical protein SS02_07865 [Enterobacter hormaechei subsp. steigerwaltii]|nr:hypothetical protein SS02_07865 [Enterobacter hormaechei subsp. steigerwaltii]
MPKLVILFKVITTLLVQLDGQLIKVVVLNSKVVHSVGQFMQQVDHSLGQLRQQVVHSKEL